MQAKPVLFSGVQPSGRLTLGNYFGALRNWVALQEQYRCLFALMDLHTITVRQDPKELYQCCYDTLALYLACGLKPERHPLFLQSQVPAHTQLAWVLGCYTYMGEMNRMTQFKEKAQKYQTNVNVGLFTYPVLMAADILLYKTNLVPVGADQKQHLELARDVALRFNNSYGEIFTIPELYMPTLGERIMSLQDPTQKMAKSATNPQATIFLLDTPTTIKNKIKRAVTDSGSDIYFDPKNKPGIANLLTILAAATARPLEQVVTELQGQGYGKLKTEVADSVIALLQPLQLKYQELRSEEAYLHSLLQSCGEVANRLAQPMLAKVYAAVGLVTGFSPH